MLTRERLDHCETRESYYCPRSLRKTTRPMEINQYWTVPRQTQRTAIPSFAKKWRLQYNHWSKGSQLELTTFSRTGPSWWRLRNRRSHDNLQQDLADRRMANPLDQVLGHHTFQERQPAAVPELPNDQPNQSPKQSHAEDHTEQTEATSGEDHRWRIDRLHSRKQQHRADLQPTNLLWEVSPAPARPLPCLQRLQEGLQQGLACSSEGNHEEVQHQHKPYQSHQKPLWQGH